MAKIWSESENEAIVKDYFVMLEYEQMGQPFNKTEHRRALMGDHRAVSWIDRVQTL